MNTPHRHGTAECREIFSHLSEYLDDELEIALRDEMECHLGDCPPCQVFLETLRRAVRWVGDSEATPLPEDVRREVREAYDRLQRERDN